MRLDKKDIEEFKRIYREEFGEEISDAEAYEMASNLLRLFKVIYKPIPAEDEDLYRSYLREIEELGDQKPKIKRQRD